MIGATAFPDSFAVDKIFESFVCFGPGKIVVHCEDCHNSTKSAEHDEIHISASDLSIRFELFESDVVLMVTILREVTSSFIANADRLHIFFCQLSQP